jgi:hypothetical protein
MIYFIPYLPAITLATRPVNPAVAEYQPILLALTSAVTGSAAKVFPTERNIPQEQSIKNKKNAC